MKININKLLRNNFFRGGIFLTLSNFLGGFLNYLFNSLTGKVLGPGGYSEIAALFSYLAIFSVPMQVISTDLIRRLGQKGKERTSVLRSWEGWFWQKILHWKFLLIPYFFSLFFLPRVTNLSLLSSFTFLLLLLISLISVFYPAVLQGIHLFFWYSLIGIIATLIKLLGPVLVYFHVDGLTTVAVFLILSSLISTILAKFFFNQESQDIGKPIKTNIDRRIIPLIFTKAILLITLSSLSLTFLNNLDVVFVKKFFSANVAGVYAGWNLFSKIIFYLTGPLTTLAFIFFSDKDQAKNHKKGLFLIVISFGLIGLTLFGLYSFFGRTLLFLIFNEKYLMIVNLLPKAAIFGSFYTLISIINGYFIAKNSFFSLTTALFIPFYGLGLLLLGKSLEAVININLIFSFLITIIYLFGALTTIGNGRERVFNGKGKRRYLF